MRAAPIRFDTLDLVRGLAALLVVAGHLRGYIFASNTSLASSGMNSGLLTNTFYLFTGLGHQAVMVFFALSGFLVGGKALGDLLADKFSWPRYLLRRLTRLWIVIFPALLLTLVFDTCGASFAPSGAYDGRFYDLYVSGPHAPEGAVHSLWVFLVNSAFLQTIVGPVFGSNGPLWSLANEFWYYVVFPLAAWVWLARVSPIRRALGAVGLGVLLGWLPVWLLEGGTIWVAGAIAARVSRASTLTRFWRTPASRLLGLVAPIAALLLSKSRFDLGDLGLGIVVAMSLPAIANLPSLGKELSAIARASSEVSYTLYLTHFPFLTFIVMSTMAPARWQPGVASALIYCGLLIAAFLWAFVVWWCFERNTDRVYALISGLIPVLAVDVQQKVASRGAAAFAFFRSRTLR